MPVNISYARGRTLKKLQERKITIERYVSDNKIKITKSFEDIGSGADFNRFGLRQMIQFVVNNQVDSLYIVCATQLDRNVLRLIELIKDINDYSTRIYVLGENGSPQELNIKGFFPRFLIGKGRKFTS